MDEGMPCSPWLLAWRELTVSARPDFAQIARRVADQATRTEHRKNPAAVELGRLGGQASAARKAQTKAAEERRSA